MEKNAKLKFTGSNYAIWEKPSALLDVLSEVRLFRYRRFWAILLLPFSLCLISIASAHPQVTEQVYAKGVYPVLAGLLGRLFAITPFSVAQLFIFALPAALLAYIIVQTVLAIREKSRRQERLSGLAATIACIIGAGYFLFALLCGFNYHRETFADISGFAVRPSSVEELVALCTELRDRANDLRGNLAEDGDGVMTSSFETPFEAARFAQSAYRVVGDGYPDLGGYTTRPKPVVASRGMSYLDITGIYMPFTFEANVNVDVPDYWIPSTMMHELAHFKGFMREDEANFISYLACTASGNADFDYSGTMLALIHSSNALYAADKDRYWQVMEPLSDGVRRDMAANAAYWKQFEGPVAQASTVMNDVYLKSNRQSSGVKSYGAMVDLLLAEHRQRHGME